MLALLLALSPAALPAADLDLIENAYLAGRSDVVIVSLSRLLARQDTDPGELSEALVKRELPPLGRVLSGCRLEIVKSGAAERLPKPERLEARLTLVPLAEEIDWELDLIRRAPPLAAEFAAPAKMEAIGKSLAEFDSHGVRVLEMKLVLDDYAALAALARTRPSSLDEPTAAAASEDRLEAWRTMLDDLDRELAERRIELRIARVELADRLLDRREPLTRDHLLAAATWREDLAEISGFAKSSHRDPPRRKSLASPGVLEEAAETARRAGREAGDLTDKAEALFQGLYWWRRGRYGAGPLHAGLVKGPAALASPALALEVWMPLEKPLPPDPVAVGGGFASGQSPAYPRRHLFWWTWADRRVEQDLVSESGPPAITTVSTSSRTFRSPCNTMSFTTATTTARTQWDGTLTRLVFRGVDQRPQGVQRLVGFQEYGLALVNFNRLLQSATGEELALMDELVQDDPQLLVYVNLSRAFKENRRSPLASPADDQQGFGRHGLAWVIALARLETGAMMAGFLPGDSPFAAVRPSGYESDEFAELVLDSMRVQAWTIDADPAMSRLTSMTNVQALTYERRITVALHLIRETAALMGSRMSPEQQREMTRLWDRHSETRRIIRQDILRLGPAVIQRPVFDKRTETIHQETITHD